MKAHQNNTKTFDELTYAEQSKSLNATILFLKSAILAHKRRAILEQKEDSTCKFIAQLEKLAQELKIN